MSDLNIITFRFADQHLLSQIKSALSDILAAQTYCHSPRINPLTGYNKERDQFDAALILSDFEDSYPAGYSILLTDVDLYIPIFTFVFGLARLGGTSGVVSACRLRNEFYGLPQNEALLLERLVKEIVHELGHLLNLRHCANFNCVMSSSNTVDDLDVKRNRYCESCLKKIAGRNEDSPGQ